ncbi:outer membrane receptor protein involved in Fe transport [Chitinophaga niastensis]|uniref:Outer membrane receptor protein involved in Fe transport n=1 Tax=Chitinophaga niastensis TaxID=536980 RepID=A0A2P8HJW9_CHINA|nr:outer membrane beta-barrel family protein [Chitinophaga niastensis]PSL46516.1 outer membrane receptor protein involved in Fe transport [Chitinophaga niastensis]
MKKTSIILVLFLGSGTLLQAQISDTGIIKGRVVDQQAFLLPDATVLLKATRDSGIYRTALSRQDGKFSFSQVKAGNYFIEISRIGFEKLITPAININETNTGTDLGELTLKSVSKMLAGVTVKGNAPLIERQIDKTVVNTDNSIISAGSTVLEMMQKLPGVQMTTEGQLTLNGKSGVNVYIDGKATYLSAGDLANLLNGMSSSTIQKVEIMTNPSAKYDATGTGGIINIVKKKNHKEGLNGSVNGSVGQSHYGKYNGSFTIGYKNQYYNLFFNNTFSYNKTLFNRIVSSNILNDDHSLLTEQVSDNNNININKTYRPTLGIDLYLSKKTILSLSGTASTGLSKDQTISIMDILDGSRKQINRALFTSNIKGPSSNYTIDMQLVHQIDTLGKELSIDMDYADYRNTPAQNNVNILHDAGGNFISESDALLQQHRQLNIYAAKADYVQPLKNEGRLEAGWKSSYVKAINDNTYYNQTGGQNIIDTAQSNYTVNEEMINAVYININKVYKKLTVQAGLRAEQTITKGKQLPAGQLVERNYLQLFPTLFFDYKLNDQNRFNIKSGRRTERAAYSEMVPFRRPLTPTLYFQGNPDLKPQLSYHSELTWSYQNTFFITLGYDIYRDYIRTLPFLDTNKINITRRPTNIQGAHSWNIDFSYSKKITNWWSTDNTLSVYKNAFNGDVNGFRLDDHGISSIYLNCNNSFQINNKLSAECYFEYNSKRQLVTSTFGPYSILSVGVKRLVLANKGTISINANNILQREGHNAIDRYSNLYQYSYWRYYTRSVSVNFIYRFGNGKGVKMRNDAGASDEQKRAGN